MITNEVLEFLNLCEFTLTVTPYGSWELSNSDEHASGDNIQTLNEFASFVMRGYPVPISIVQELGDLRDFAT
jgi:hypothetical protein